MAFFGVCSRVGSVRTVLPAIQPPLKRYGFLAQCPPTESRVRPQLLGLDNCSYLSPDIFLHVFKSGHFR
jgi:hypothetical protein